MIIQKIILSTLLLSWLAGSGIGAQPVIEKKPALPLLLNLAELLPPALLTEVQEKGKVIRTSMNGTAAVLPGHSAAAALRMANPSEKPGLLVEALFILPRPRPSDVRAELAQVYGILKSIDSLQGIEYFSASRKEMRTFYVESWVIDGPVTRKRLPDSAPPAVGSLPEREALYVWQKDLSFGGNVYSYAYEAGPDYVSLKSNNVTGMSYGILPVLGPGGLTTHLLIIQAVDGILFYASSAAQAPGLMKGKLEDSFGNRAEALFRWFKDRAKVALGY